MCLLAIPFNLVDFRDPSSIKAKLKTIFQSVTQQQERLLMLTKNEEQWHNVPIQLSNDACLDRAIMIEIVTIGFRFLRELLLLKMIGHFAT